jgi:hypothetical protein
MQRPPCCQGGGGGWASHYNRRSSGGFRYWPVGGTNPQHQRVAIPQDDGVIEGEFEIISPPPSDSRDFVPSTGGAVATFDSRLDATLKRNALARRTSHGHRIGGQASADLGQLFQINPHGDRTLTALDQAAKELAGVQAERRQLALERQEAASRAVAVRSQQPPELGGLIRRGLRDHCRRIASPSKSSTGECRNAAIRADRASGSKSAKRRRKRAERVCSGGACRLRRRGSLYGAAARAEGSGR